MTRYCDMWALLPGWSDYYFKTVPYKLSRATDFNFGVMHQRSRSMMDLCRRSLDCSILLRSGLSRVTGILQIYDVSRRPSNQRYGAFLPRHRSRLREVLPFYPRREPARGLRGILRDQSNGIRTFKVESFNCYWVCSRLQSASIRQQIDRSAREGQGHIKTSAAWA